MNSLSFGALSLVLTFLTPALPMWFIYRLAYVKNRTIPTSDGIILLFCCFFSWFVNGAFITSYLKNLLDLGLLADLTNAQTAKLLPLLLESGSTSTCIVNEYLCRFCHFVLGENVKSTGFLAFTFELHFRAAIFAVLVIILCKIPGHLEGKAQLVPFKDNYPQKISYWDRVLLLLAGIWKPSTFQSSVYERVRIRYPWLRLLREGFYHPWSFLTAYNKKREVLMVDVFTKEGSLYSGALTSWTPGHDQGISAIAMEYVLRYYPKAAAEDRKKALVKHNGELIVLAKDIETVHFWELRVNHKVTVVVRKLEDIEKLKWVLILKYIFPKFMTDVSAHVLLSSDDYQKFFYELKRWAKDNDIETFIGKMKVMSSKP